MLHIEPIRLLAGCHTHTGHTGQGCFLNVCSYLQGDAKITDEPSSVNRALHAPLIALNDGMSGDMRQKLLPFVHRAMLTGDRPASHMVPALLMFVELAQELSRKAEHPVRYFHDRAIESSYAEAKFAIGDVLKLRDGGAFSFKRDDEIVALSNAVAAALSRVLRLIGQHCEVSGYRFVADDKPLDYAILSVAAMQAMSVRYTTVGEYAVEQIVETLDRVLPREETPAPEVKSRATELVAVREAWGSKPLPAKEPKAKTKPVGGGWHLPVPDLAKVGVDMAADNPFVYDYAKKSFKFF